jgi:hypothetical protein
MRPYNFVVDITPDFENIQYRIRAIDFDQQCYEGRKNLYLPQFFKENLPFVETVIHCLNKESVLQYQAEERSRLVFRVVTERYRLKELLDVMQTEELSKPEKIGQLKVELANHFKQTVFLKAETMGQILKIQLKQTLRNSLLLVPKQKKR